ncbi:MAG TPA: tetratricopeptide repeat protein [Candidatus Acidoferrum sp.]|nr:tetratricopeptide repeat protein [Candidatus Acidoferrum sp.]
MASAILTLLTFVPAQSSAYPQQKNLDRDFKTAVSLYEAGKYPDAATQLEKLVREVPESFEVHELLGLVYAAQSQDARAAQHLQKAVSLKPDSAPARTNLAANFARMGKLDLATEQFKRAVELDPRSFETNHNLGESYVRSGKVAEAVPYLEEAQRIASSSYDNGYDLSLAYLQIGRLADAQQLIQALLKQQNTAELHNLLGEVEEKEGKFVPAENEYETAAHMDPSESNLFDWGSELLLHRTLGPAVEVFQQASARYPTSQRMVVGLGMALYARGNYDDAVKALLGAADLNPTEPNCYFFLSRAYDSSPSQADEVTQRFHRFAELQPNNARALYYYAMSLWKGKRAQDPGLDLNQIESLLSKSLALDPKLSEAHLQLGNLYSDQAKFAEAIPEYKRALQLNSDLADAYYRLGQAYVRTGEKDRAQEQFQVYQKIREQHLADVEKQRAEIRQFVYSAKDSPSAKP